jgi:hypothetical protein
MRRLFTGYSVQNTKGWYRDPETGKEVRDRHFRVDVDLPVTPRIAKRLRNWKNILELRFDQTEIYMRFSERVFWLKPFTHSHSSLREPIELNVNLKNRKTAPSTKSSTSV